MGKDILETKRKMRNGYFKKGTFFEILCENIGMYFKNMQELHIVKMICVQEHSDKGITRRM